MKNEFLFNNIGICSLGIGFTLAHIKILPIAKALLIMPFITHSELLKYLSNENVKVKSLEDLIMRKMQPFSNFNDRFYDTLCLSINTIQFLHEIDIIKLDSGNIVLLSEFNYEKKMGNRANLIYKASTKLATILDDSFEKLYLNLRIEL